MIMATLTVSFTAVVPAPADGYIVKYREAGGGSYIQVSPNPTASPVVITGLDGTKAYEGFIQSACESGIMSDPVQFSVGAIAVLDNFDFLVLRYKNNSGGTDLDTFTGFADNGLSVDINYGSNTNWVGFSGPGSGYITWGGDNTSAGGVEAVLIDFKKLIDDFPSAPDSIRLRLHAWWYNSRTTGAAQLELQTWLGGTVPTASGYDFVKSDGSTVDNILLDTNVTCVRAGVSPQVNCAQRLGEIIYNKITKTAVLVPTTGGCGCSTCRSYTLTNSFNPEETVEYTACDGSPATIPVSAGTQNICALEGTVYSPNGWVTVDDNGSC
jgi:hypothetical protein